MLRSCLFLVLIVTFTQASLRAQENIDLENKLKNYLEASTPADKYDNLAEIMEFNANLSLAEAEFYDEKLASLSYENKDHRYALLAHFIMADVLYYNELVDSSLNRYLMLGSAAASEDEYMLAATGIGNAAYVLSKIGDKLGAINLLKQNKEISSRTGDIRDLSDHTYAIAKNYADLEVRDSAIHYFELTVDLDRTANNREGMLYNMATLLEQYLASGKNTEAQQLCGQCISIAKQIGQQRAAATCQYFSAIAFYETAAYEQGEEAIKKAIKIDDSRSDGTRLSKYYKVLGDIEVAEKKYKEASEHFQQAIAFAEKNKQLDDVVASSLAFSEGLRKQGQLARAQSHNEKAEELIKDNNLSSYLLPLYRNASKLYADQGDLRQALSYQEKESALLSSRLAAKNLLATEQSRNAFDLFKMENVNRALQAEKEVADAKLKRRNILIVSGGIIVLLALGLLYFVAQFQAQKSREKEQELEFQVLEKEMTALRSQMNPHFLFNSLSSINDYIMHENPRLASKYLTKFSHLMRTILNNSREKLITVEEELKASTLYVEMENLRFKEQFDFELKIDPEIDPGKVMIPSMLIQPNLENAIKHGLRNSNLPGKLRLELIKVGEELHIEIEDNGVGRAVAMKLKSRRDGRRKSLGMAITTDRIDLLNKIHDIDAGSQIIDKTGPSGTLIRLKIRLLSKESEVQRETESKT